MNLHKVKYNIGLVFMSLAILSACSSSGEDTPQPSFEVKGEFRFTDVEFWPENQEVVVGLYESNSNQEIKTHTLNKPGNTSVSYVFTGVQEGSYDIRLVVTENSVYKSKLFEKKGAMVNADVQIPAQTVTMVFFDRIQEQVLNSCLACHGNSNEVAAGLYLTADKAYSQLVNVNSTKSEMKRVLPGEPDKSFLVKVLQRDGLSFDHAASSTATKDDQTLVENWISAGAKDN